MSGCIHNIAHIFSRLLPDKLYLQLKYHKYFGKWINFKNPTTFNEKLQWLKIHDRRPVYTTMVDKYAVRQYIADTIGEQYLVPLLGVWDNVDEIDFDALPNQFVLKCTHDSGGLVICKDKSKLDKKAAQKKISSSLKRNFYYYCREWPYKDVHPRIIAEKFLDAGNEGLKDYKIMCFGGEVRCVFVCSEREGGNLRITIFDRDWNVLPCERPNHRRSDNIPEKPAQYEQMVKIAEYMSKSCTFLRVDFYEHEGNIYLGELTLYPGGGFEEFTPESWDETLGSWIQLPKIS